MYIYTYIHTAVKHIYKHTYIHTYSSKNVINANCLSFDDPFLASKKDSQGVI